MANTISNNDDVINSRDVIERIEELRGDGVLPWDDSKGLLGGEVTAEDYEPTSEEVELHELEKLADEASGYAADWDRGGTLIRDSYFTEYAQQLAEDCCEMPRGNRWPMYCIDWEWAARYLQIDYTQVYFDDVAYWIR